MYFCWAVCGISFQPSGSWVKERSKLEKKFKFRGRGGKASLSVSKPCNRTRKTKTHEKNFEKKLPPLQPKKIELIRVTRKTKTTEPRICEVDLSLMTQTYSKSQHFLYCFRITSSSFYFNSSEGDLLFRSIAIFRSIKSCVIVIPSFLFVHFRGSYSSRPAMEEKKSNISTNKGYSKPLINQRQYIFFKLFMFTFPNELVRRVFLTIKSFFSW